MVSSRKMPMKGGKKQMQPFLWQPPVELSEQEEQIVKRIRKAKLFVFCANTGMNCWTKHFSKSWQVCTARQSEDNHP